MREPERERPVGIRPGFGVSLIGCLAGTAAHRAEDDAVLKDFYRRVRPWGFWSPILRQVVQEDPSFQRNRDFWRDMFNVVVGIRASGAGGSAHLHRDPELPARPLAGAVVAVASVILKITWYTIFASSNRDGALTRNCQPAELSPAGLEVRRGLDVRPTSAWLLTRNCRAAERSGIAVNGWLAGDLHGLASDDRVRRVDDQLIAALTPEVISTSSP